MTRTEQFVREWLANPAHIHTQTRHEEVVGKSNGFDSMIMRNHFELRNGGTISIQQGASHYCDKDSVELWLCPHKPILEPYGWADDDGNYSNPYSHVPISVLADYIDILEGVNRMVCMCGCDFQVNSKLKISWGYCPDCGAQ